MPHRSSLPFDRVHLDTVSGYQESVARRDAIPLPAGVHVRTASRQDSTLGQCRIAPILPASGNPV